MAKENEIKNPYLKRYTPDCRFNPKLIEYSLNPKKFEESITDKEAYRVTLASMRGVLANGPGSSTVGQYSLKDGKYDPHNDHSYLNRPDLTIVDVDKYIKDFEVRLKESDGELTEQIKLELESAKAKKAELEKVPAGNSDKESE